MIQLGFWLIEKSDCSMISYVNKALRSWSNTVVTAIYNVVVVVLYR